MAIPLPSTASACLAPPSLIETMRIDAGGAIPLLDGHLARLERSCIALGYAWPGHDLIKERVRTEARGLTPEHTWRLRLLMAPSGEMVLEHSLLERLVEPLKVRMGGLRLDIDEEWLQYKSTHRPWYEHAARWLAQHPDIFDLLYWNRDGEMSEGSRSNLYIQNESGRWITPPLASGALPGVQRNALLLAGLVHEAPIPRDEFLSARRRRISNALRGWCNIILEDVP